jgi:hypothetical protein
MSCSENIGAASMEREEEAAAVAAQPQSVSTDASIAAASQSLRRSGEKRSLTLVAERVDRREVNVRSGRAARSSGGTAGTIMVPMPANRRKPERFVAVTVIVTALRAERKMHSCPTQDEPEVWV